ncbi:MAG TPA: hypothetical protein VJL37_10020 [Flavobacterium sp.]|nr:hypothetical protein [Flavobacterium sp.]
MNTTSDFEIEQQKHSISIPETGHAKNAYNFQLLITFCQSLGAIYNPSNNRLKIDQLQLLEQSAFEVLHQVQVQRENFHLQTNNRRKVFEDIKPFATKIINAFAASGVEKEILEEAKAINKRIQGVQLKGIPTHTTGEVCTSQQSYDHKMEHFASLIAILENNPVYHPNEEELKLSTLQAKLNCLQTSNAELAHSYTLYSEALQERNHLLYNLQNGLLHTVKEVKQYVKSVYGANSSQYHEIGQLQFKVRSGE